MTPALLARFDGLAWAGGPVEAWRGGVLPADVPASSASVLVTAGDAVLLVDVLLRGWDLPGGHLEAGEDAVGAVLRELEEEAGVGAAEVTAPILIGWFRLVGAVMPVFTARLADDGLPGRRFVTGVPHEIGDVRFFPLAALPPVASSRIWFPYVDVVRASAP